MILLAILGPMLVINFLMDFGWFKSVGHGSDDGWLGFWGGYLGSIIAVSGVYWQVREEIRNGKMEQYKEARPIFMLDIMDNSKYCGKEGPINYNIKPVEFPAYISEKCCKECKYRFAWCNKDLRMGLPYIQLKNISNNPMLAIKAKLIWENDTEESFIVNRLDANSNMSLLNIYTYKYYCKTQLEKIPALRIKPDILEYVELYYLTSRNEKIFMKFKIYGGYKSPNLIEKKLEGKGDHFSLDEYQIDNSVESKKILTK